MATDDTAAAHVADTILFEWPFRKTKYHSRYRFALVMLNVPHG
jgi:hypothetical protein